MANNYELYHYGVKGMKWGVRKDIYKKIRKGAGKESYEISSELARDKTFRTLVNERSELRTARKEFMELANRRDEMFDSLNKKMSKKELNKLIDDEIQKNKDSYEYWFNDDGSVDDDLRSILADSIQSNNAYKNKQFNEVNDAYNKAWKEYDRLKRQTVQDFVGMYGDRTVRTVSKWYGPENTRIRKIVDIALTDAIILEENGD